MAQRKKTLLGVLVASGLVHWFALDGMRARENSVQNAPLLAARLAARETVSPPAVPSQPPASVDKSVTPGGSRARSRGTDRKQVAAAVHEDSLSPASTVPGEGAVMPMFRPMSPVEVEAMARVRIGLSMRAQRFRLTEPVVIRLSLSPTGALEVSAADPAQVHVAQDLLLELREVLSQAAAVRQTLQSGPLELEFLP